MVSEREQRKKNANVCFSTPSRLFERDPRSLARRRISDRRPMAPYAYAIRILQTDPGILHGVARTSAILTFSRPPAGENHLRRITEGSGRDALLRRPGFWRTGKDIRPSRTRAV